MAMNKAETIIAFHNMLSMQVKNMNNGAEIEEYRPSHSVSLFRFGTETEGLTYAVQTNISIVDNAYNVDVAIIEETMNEDGERIGELVDNKVFKLRDLGFKEEGVKLVHKYIRGMVKAVLTNEEQVFSAEEE